MSTITALKQGEELARMDVLRAYKGHLRREGKNVSPFETDQVIRYDTEVAACDVPEIHCHVRKLIEEALTSIHGANSPRGSQVVILAGAPGMGKSHLINYFRTSAVAEQYKYVLICNSNHWSGTEFEECLLDWILEALVRPSPNGEHLLHAKIEDIAFQALSQLLAQPGQIRRFKGKGPSSWLRRVWAMLAGRDRGRFQYMVDQRDARVFRLVNFNKFAGYVCDRFLPRAGNPFHRYTLRVLLQYVFEEDRETVLHWLRRKPVGDAFLKRLATEDNIDRHYKVVDVIKILISLFSANVADPLSTGKAHQSAKRVFFFAFDQTEGRDELFDSEDDWVRFFAQLSELYNTLPNVFILFTMTVNLRKELYGKMEGQFQDRIRGDQRFWLQEVPDDEILTLYRKRVDAWLAAGTEDLRKATAELAEPYLPFDQETVLSMGRDGKSLREVLETFDREFRRCIDEDVTEEDPRHDYLVSQNEVRREEEIAKPFDYTETHLEVVKELFEQAGQEIASGYGLSFGYVEDRPSEDSRPALCLEFRAEADPTCWIRIFLARLPFRYNTAVPGYINMLKGKQLERNFLWLVRSEKIDPSLAAQRLGQVFARRLDTFVQTNVRALLRLISKRDRYTPDQWVRAVDVIRGEIKLTYLGEMLQQASDALENLRTKQ